MIYKLFIMEKWVDINGFEGLYRVSNTGKVRSVPRRSKNNGSYSGYVTVKSKELKQTVNRHGYHVITLYKSGVRYFKIVHRLVAESFIYNPNNYKEVNHIDMNKSNNNVANLEWCDREYNINHMYKNKNTSSKYKGVSFDKNRKLWQSYVDINKKRLSLGRFETEEDANQYRLNFIKQLKTINYD